MHIKQVVLAGFKSYRDETVVEELDPGLNVIVGKNGTGKSNIFNAIRYVLDDGESDNLRNSVGTQRGQEAFVELVFDNTSRRFMTFGDEVTIKRSLDTPSDFWINGKKTLKNDVLNNLESAGFGRYNPFYVVPQGKVASLINATDEERLELLLTASGLDLFERKKKQAQKSINKSLKEIDQIEGTLGAVDNRINILEEEIHTLERFQEVQFEQRRFQYEGLTREFTIVEGVLDEVVAKLEQLREAEAEADATFAKTQASQQLKESRISELKCTIDSITAQIDLENIALAKNKQTDVQDPNEYNELIATADAEIEAKSTELNRLKEQLAANQLQHSEVVARLETLQLKASQSSKFTSQEKRDEWLREQVAKTTEEIESQKALQATLESEMSAMDIPMVPTDSIDQFSAQLTEAKEKVHEEQANLQAAQAHLKTAQLESRKNMIRIETIQEHMDAIVNRTSDSTLIDVVAAIDHAHRFAKELDILDKFYGPLANLITIDETYATAVETIAKSALFYCVVEDTETARLLAKEMSAIKGGRLSFIPLADISTKPAITLRESDQEHAAVLMDMIECDERFRPALRLVMGDALLCPDLDTSWNCSRTYKVDCVTIEGSFVSHYGALRGGTQKPRSTSRFEALKALTEIYERRSLALAKVKENEAAVDASQQRVTSAHNALADAKKHVTVVFTQLEEARRAYSRECIELESAVQERDYKSQQLQRTLSTIESLGVTKQRYHSELGAPFAEPPNESELEEMRLLSSKAESLQDPQLEQRVAQAQRLLDGLKAQKWDAELAKERSFSDSSAPSGLATESELSALEAQRTEALNEVAALRLELQEDIAQVTEGAARLFKLQKEVKKQEFREEKYFELMKSVGAQGKSFGFELDETKDLEDLTDAQLEEKCQELESEMNRFGPINMLAREQYNKYKKDHTQESQKRAEIEKDLEESQKMIERLDSYKSKAIVKTFKDVQTRFSKFFKSLTRTDTATLQVEGGKDPLEWHGLGMSVSFARHRKLRIEQLSGGQKALCALAFLLSLQATDPAPFYIFDEVDASLDTQYRGSLADALKQISTKLEAQFICTTFSPELVQTADKIYGTAFGNNTSSVGPIDRELALSLVDVSGQDVSRVLG